MIARMQIGISIESTLAWSLESNLVEIVAGLTGFALARE